MGRSRIEIEEIMLYGRMKVICAYSANIDAICTVSGEALSNMISKDRNFKIDLKKSIKSRNDLLSSLLYCMRQGSGAEVLIEDRQAAWQIGSDQAFSWRPRLGGNAAIMANVLAALGAEPILNSPALTPRLAELLHPKVRLPEGGELLDPVQAVQAVQSRGKDIEDMVHYVFQFQENDTVSAGKENITAPKANRFIATYDPVNSRLLTSEGFDSYCRDSIESIAGAIVSGFQLAAGSREQAIFSGSATQIKSWKQKNARLFIHAEMGSFAGASTMNSLLEILSQIPIDSLGLNEDEIALALPDAALRGWQEHDLPEEWPQFLRSAEGLRRRLGLFRVAVHTGDYILSVMKAGRISPRQELAALQSGTDAAASLAATGSAAGNLGAQAEVNSAGLQAKEMLCRLDGGRAEGRGAYLISGDLIVSLMPSLLVRNPSFTVGLGDTATSAIFLRELEAII